MKKILFSLVFGMMAIVPSSQAYKIGNTGYHFCKATNCTFGQSDGTFIWHGACPSSATFIVSIYLGGTHGWQDFEYTCNGSELTFNGAGASYNSANDTHVSLNTANKIGFDVDTDRVNCVDLGSHTLSSAAGTSTSYPIKFTDSCTYEYVDYEDHFYATDGITTVNVPL